MRRRAVHDLIWNEPDGRAIQDRLIAEFASPYQALIHWDIVGRYLENSEYIRRFKASLYEQDPNVFLKNFKFLRKILVADEMRDLLLHYYDVTPWMFYVQSEFYADLFGMDYFTDRLIADPELFSRDPSLFAVFRFFHASSYLTDDFVAKYLAFCEFEELPAHIDSVRISDSRIPGFGCGGMDRNFRMASVLGKGLCLVDNVFLAKKYHRRGGHKAKKLTLIVKNNIRLDNGQVLWKDQIYAFSGGDHVFVVDAIDAGNAELRMGWDMILKSSRPLIGATSEEVFANFELRASLGMPSSSYGVGDESSQDSSPSLH